MCSSKTMNFLLAWKSLAEKRDGVTTEVTPELLVVLGRACVCDEKYSW